MNRIEYIRYSHRRANSRVRAWIGSVRMRLVRRSRLLGWIWMVPASIFYALVVLFSWLTFCVVLFRDPRFTLHYLESEIECRGLSGAEARRYLDEQHRDYERRLAYSCLSFSPVVHLHSPTNRDFLSSDSAITSNSTCSGFLSSLRTEPHQRFAFP